MTRILHTSDWHLGRRHARLPGDVGARAREARFTAVERLAALATEHEVDVVVVCGDVFDDDLVGNEVIQRAADALANFGCPVLLLPGNHDSSSSVEGALPRLAAVSGAHVSVCFEPEPVEVGGTWFHPAPLGRKHYREDPAAHLEPTPNAPSVALVHGADKTRSAGRNDTNVIDVEALVGKGFDYVALGDWHCQLVLGPRAAYSGTPEQARWGERDTGHALLVELDEAGGPPMLTPVASGRLKWVDLPWELQSAEDVDALAAQLAAVPERSSTLVRLRATGALSMDALAALEALIAESDTFLSMESDISGVRLAPTEAELSHMTPPGFLGDAVRALLETRNDVDLEALTLLNRFLPEDNR